MIAPRLRRPDVRRAVVLFPSGLTLGNLFFGVFAIVEASRGGYARAGLYVILGGICDAFDGRVARATGTGGKFGEELDSLVDAITFGLAPALIMYFAVLNRDGWDWVFAFFFTMCAVLRLARFNVVQAGTSKSYFQGLPTPAAGITLATYYWFSQSTLYTETVVADWPWDKLLRVVMAVLSFLMISNVPYPVVPKLSLRSLEGWFAVIFLAGGVGMLVFRKWELFFPLAMAYVTFGLVRAVLLGWLERGRHHEEIEDSVPHSEVEEAEDQDYERAPLRQRSTPQPRRPTPISRPAIAGGAPVPEASDEPRRRRKRRRKPRTDRTDPTDRPDRAGGGDARPDSTAPESPEE